MKKLVLFIFSKIVLSCFFSPAYSQEARGPKFFGGLTFAGAQIYQDEIDTLQFYYAPSAIDLVMGETLQDFNVKYWGIGKPFYKQTDKGTMSSIGAILAGKATFDLSKNQRKLVIAEIKRAYKLENVEPKLKGLSIRTQSSRPVFAENTLGFGEKSDVRFPDTFAVGTTFNYLLATGGNLFASTVAGFQEDQKIIPNPQFGINIIGEAEFIGAPWESEITANYSQIWKEVRQKYSASVSLGWFRIGTAEYNSLVQDLQKSGAIKFKMIEGSLDNEKFGRAIFETMKSIFEEMNKNATGGEGFFKFEPNPSAANIDAGNSSLFGGWGLSINGGYSSAQLTQEIIVKSTISYKGRFYSNIPMSLTLAVNCTNATKKYFQDIADTKNNCITQIKIQQTQERLQKEAKAKNTELKKLAKDLILGKITNDQYDRLFKLYNEYSFTEDINNINNLTKKVKSTAYILFKKQENKILRK
jgi:hypothetical protein